MSEKMTKIFKINGIDVREFNDFIIYLNFYLKNGVDIFSAIENSDHKRWLWVIYGLGYILNYVFNKREQPTSIDDIFEAKLKIYFRQRNKTPIRNFKIIDKIKETLNTEKFKPIKEFLTETTDLDVNEIIKKYPIFSEQEKIKDELKRKGIKIFSLQELKNISSMRLTPTYEKMLRVFINNKGFLLFYKENDTKELFEFFSWHHQILNLLTEDEKNVILNSLPQYITLFNDDEIDKIKNIIVAKYPTGLEYLQKMEKFLHTSDQNFIKFLKNPEKIDREKIEKIFKGINGYENINPHKFFNTTLNIEKNDIKKGDFVKLLNLVNLTIDLINQNLKDYDSNEIDFWLQNSPISLFFRFIYLSLNIFFNFTFDNIEKTYLH
jgi:hypothetical protein